MTRKITSAGQPFAASHAKTSRKRLQNKSTLNSGYGIFLIPGIVMFTIIIILPFLMNIGVSFTKWQGIGTPVWIGLTNYQKLMRDTTFWASFKNNLILIIAITIIPTIIGLLLSTVLFGYVADRFGKPVSNFFRGGFYLPQILPVAIAGVIWGWLLQPDGTFNWFLRSIGLGFLAHNWLGDAATALPTVMVIMIWFQIGYPLVIFMSALQRIDPELLEAAALDGASGLQGFFYITLQIIRPEIFVVILTTTIYALKIFGQIFVLTRGGPGTATMVPSYFAYQNFFEKSNVGYGAAISTIMTLIILVVTVLFINFQTRQGRSLGENL
ncbi:MAG: sugar ABC transporter permease [Anaerolineae bacterium]|nr:sugar ABC transporter permease [Anaerolineae bacterium]